MKTIFLLEPLLLLCSVLFTGAVSGKTKTKNICSAKTGMTSEQRQICKVYQDHMSQLIEGGKIAIEECEKQFANQRWNCTFPKSNKKKHFLHPPMDLATKESAFLHSIISAGTMHIMSRVCMLNELASHCSCGKGNRPDGLPQSHLWQGCGDNLKYGFEFTKMFLDAKEELNEESLESMSNVLMNIHNNEAGRWAVYKKSIIQCRCYGVTKNCATKICHRQLSHFKEVSKHLRQLYQRSIRVKLEETVKSNGQTEAKLVEVNKKYDKITPLDLIFTHDSPSYCTKNLNIGSFGTRGRQCNKSGDSLTSCSTLCCGRGYHTEREIVKYKCFCSFFYCCEVRCKTCETEMDIYHCK